jgi:hypothetical protein
MATIFFPQPWARNALKGAALTLTELPQHPQPPSLRLPSLPGMLAQHYGQAQRARQRRVMIADHPGQNLRALEVMDNTIDRMILACSLYGSEASDYFDARLYHAQHELACDYAFLGHAEFAHVGHFLGQALCTDSGHVVKHDGEILIDQGTHFDQLDVATGPGLAILKKHAITTH